MKIEPLPGIVYLKTEPMKVGTFDTSSRSTAVEYAEVIAVGDEIHSVKVGDKIFVKSWAIDIINHDGEDYRFCNIESKGILAIVRDE